MGTFNGEVMCGLESNNRFLECYIDELLLVKRYWKATSTSVKLTTADYKSNTVFAPVICELFFYFGR